MIEVIKEEKDYLLVNLNLEEANLSNADEFKSALTGLLNSRNKAVMLNMSQVSYIDSSFLGALVAALKHALALQLDIVLVGLKKDVHDLLKLIRLDKVFKIYDSFNQAANRG